MKKKYLLMAAAALLVVGTMIGGSLASLNATTNEAAVTKVSTNAFSVGITATGEDFSATGLIDEQATPGASYDLHYCATNDEETSYSMYVRVVITKQWLTAISGEDEQEEETWLLNSADQDSTDGTVSYISNTALDPSKIVLNALTEDGTDFVSSLEDAGWILANDYMIGEEEIIMYYTKPLAYGESTTDFITGVTLSDSLDNDYAKQLLQVDAVVNAVQAGDSAVSAMQAEWGVSPTIDSDGTITAISETY